jgi:hypothetical protein
MQFSQVAAAAAIASVASAGYVNVTSTADVWKNSTTVITITSCEENKCSEVPVTTGVTVVTETKNGVVTEYTTYCPLTTETGATSTVTAKVTSTKVTSTGSAVSTSTKVTSTASHQNTSVPTISTTFTGGAVKAVPAVAALAAGVALLF